MTDRPLDDDAFERALRATLERLAPDTAPGSLHAAVAAVPLRRPRGLAGPRRALFSVVGIAAAVVLAVAGLGLATGLRLPTGGLPPVETPSPAGPSPSSNTFTFRVVPADGSTATKTQVSAVGDVMSARLAAYGLGTFSWSASDDRITFRLPDTLDARSVDAIRELLGSTGAFSILQPVATPPEQLDHVTGPTLLTRDAITDARVGMNQTGNPTLDLTLTPSAAVTLGDASRTHIGEYVPMVLDGVAVSVPVIRAEIPNGEVQIDFASDDTVSARKLAAILQAGPLPLPVELVTP